MAIIRSVSLTKEHADMVDRDKVSLSAVLRTALEQLHLYKTGELLDTTASLQAKVERLGIYIKEYRAFMEKEGIINKFDGILEQKQ